MRQNDLEYALSRRLDGLLIRDESGVVADRLARDPAARRSAEQYQKVDDLLKSLGEFAASEADLEASTRRLSRRIDAWEAAAAPARNPWKIGPWVAGAAAAAVAGALGLTLFTSSAGPVNQTVAFAPPMPVVVPMAAPTIAATPPVDGLVDGSADPATFVAVVAAPSAEAAAGPAVARVEVGPPADAGRRGFQFPQRLAIAMPSILPVAPDAFPRPSRIIIAAAPALGHGGEPY